METTTRSLFSIVGVYLPCIDQGVDCYREHLVELEHVVSESRLLGPVAVLGDLNAHLGLLEGEITESAVGSFGGVVGKM